MQQALGPTAIVGLKTIQRELHAACICCASSSRPSFAPLALFLSHRAEFLGPDPDHLSLDALSVDGCGADLAYRGGSASFNWGQSPPEGVPLFPFERSGAGRSSPGSRALFGSGLFCHEGARELRDSDAHGPSGCLGLLVGLDGLAPVGGPEGVGHVSAPASSALRPRPFPARSDAWRQSPSEPRPLTGRNIYGGSGPSRWHSDSSDVSESDGVHEEHDPCADHAGSRGSSFSHVSSHSRDHAHAAGSDTRAGVERGDAAILSWLSMVPAIPPTGRTGMGSLRPAAGYGWPAP